MKTQGLNIQVAEYMDHPIPRDGPLVFLDLDIIKLLKLCATSSDRQYLYSEHTDMGERRNIYQELQNIIAQGTICQCIH